MFAPIIAVVNKSAKVSNDEVVLMVRACQLQLTEHYNALWGDLQWFVIFYADETLVPARAYPMFILDDPDAAGALGYHAENSNRPYGRIFANPVLDSGGVTLYDPSNPQNVTVSSVLSHEVLEMRQDVFASYWSDGIQATYAMEVADPVQENSYSVSISGKLVSLSNFVTPAWFNAQSTQEQYDYMGILTEPYSLSSGGYAIVRTAGPGTEQQIFGKIMPPKWKMDLKKKLGSRTLKRIVENTSAIKPKKWWKYLF
jgi:hypothetical protein